MKTTYKKTLQYNSLEIKFSFSKNIEDLILVLKCCRHVNTCKSNAIRTWRT
jgi:hypothetical protein